MNTLQSNYSGGRFYRQRGAVDRFVPAILLIVLGLLFLLSNLNVWRFGAVELWRLWPTLLIVVGLVKIADAADPGGKIAGALATVVGALMLANTFGYLSFRWTALWPLIMIGIGLSLLAERLGWGHSHGSAPPLPPGKLAQETAIFGGGKRQYHGQEFTGGKFDAVFGGFEIDLRGAAMPSESAVLLINTVFGGAEVRVPEDWLAVLQGSGIFGGYSDSTHPPNPVTPATKRLYIRGSAIFGGVDVKN